MTTTRSPIYSLLVGTLLINLVILGLASGVAAIWFGKTALISVISGSAIAMASFAVLVTVVASAVGSKSKALFVAGIGMIKMLAIGFVLWWLLSHHIVEPLAFLAGFTTMVAALLIKSVKK